MPVPNPATTVPAGKVICTLEVLEVQRATGHVNMAQRATPTNLAAWPREPAWPKEPLHQTKNPQAKTQDKHTQTRNAGKVSLGIFSSIRCQVSFGSASTRRPCICTLSSRQRHLPAGAPGVVSCQRPPAFSAQKPGAWKPGAASSPRPLLGWVGHLSVDFQVHQPALPQPPSDLLQVQ